MGGSDLLRHIRSLFHLALTFWGRQLLRIVRGLADDGGERRFLENYAGEGMVPLTVQEESLIRDLERCIFCGLCEAVCPRSTPHAVERWPAYSRAITLAELAAEDIPLDCPSACSACAEICPTRVPLTAIPALIHRNRLRSGAESSDEPTPPGDA